MRRISTNTAILKISMYDILSYIYVFIGVEKSVLSSFILTNFMHVCMLTKNNTNTGKSFEQPSLKTLRYERTPFPSELLMLAWRLFC